jgi:membrane-bound lytic murein transglycosylase D
LLWATAAGAGPEDPPATPPSATPPPASAPPGIAPGPQAEPPGPAAPTQRTIETDPALRRAVRGCSIDSDCRERDRATLLEFEREAFPAPGATSPWSDGDDAMGLEAIRTSGVRARADTDADLAARPRPRLAAGSPDPLSLRPDLPWLADLELPDLPVHWDHRTIRYLEFYKEDPRGRRLMSVWLRDRGKYRDLILAHLRRAGLPDDLFYVCMIESSYDALEYSRAGASGLWQFMPAAARVYGLTVNRWLDERNDPELSTQAAMHYFVDLEQRFGSWDLALAAYNAGYGAVLRAIGRFNTNDFWQLLEYESGLPWGSRIYVPKAIAAAIVGKNQAVFGFADVADAPAVVFDRVTVPRSVSFQVIARAAGTDVDTIRRLNPQLRRGRTPPDGGGYVVRIPIGHGPLFAARFEQLRGEWDTHDAYVVRHGERFEDIATTYGLGERELAELNGVEDQAEIGGGMVLVVPRLTEAEKRANRQRAEDDLYRSGEPRGGPDDPLIVAVPDKDLRVDGKTPVFYRVVAGDSQWQIAHTFGVTPTELAAWNGLDPAAHVHPRMVLWVWVDPDFDAAAAGMAVLDPTRILIVTSGSEEHTQLAEGRLGRRRLLYTVKRGGTFADIGRKFGLSKYDIARINHKPPDTRLEKGDQVIVYEVIDKTRSRRAARQADRVPKRRPEHRPPARKRRPASRGQR